MGIWKSVRDVAAVSRVDDKFYALAYDEFSSGRRRKGLWAKAIVQGEGDQSKAEAMYLKLLVQRHKDECYLRGQDEQTHNAPKDDGESNDTAIRTACVNCAYYEPKLWDPTTGWCTLHARRTSGSGTCDSFFQQV